MLNATSTVYTMQQNKLKRIMVILWSLSYTLTVTTPIKHEYLMKIIVTKVSKTVLQETFNEPSSAVEEPSKAKK